MSFHEVNPGLLITVPLLAIIGAVVVTAGIGAGAFVGMVVEGVADEVIGLPEDVSNPLGLVAGSLVAARLIMYFLSPKEAWR
ncbi:MAG: hypothetical protein AAB955_02490 [Patescibacteria group bacterium]